MKKVTAILSDADTIAFIELCISKAHSITLEPAPEDITEHRPKKVTHRPVSTITTLQQRILNFIGDSETTALEDIRAHLTTFRYSGSSASPALSALVKLGLLRRYHRSGDDSRNPYFIKV